jgi:hypothetical protein
MKILKIGILDWPESRWEDSGQVYDEVYLFQRDENYGENYNWIHRIPLSKNSSLKRRINSILFYLLDKSVGNRNVYLVIINLMRLLNLFTLRKLSSLDVIYCHSSYNDYDRSDHLTVLAFPFLPKKPLVRSVKETRNKFRYPELFCLENSTIQVFNSSHHRNFFETKYSRKFINSIIDIDEDYRPSSYFKNFTPTKKLSDSDDKIHIVILSGRVFSDPSNIRSGARQYYIDLIKECVNLGYHVDLYTAEIIKDINNIDQYHEIEKISNKKFRIMGKLNFRDEPLKSYSTLSKYDFGILHNYIKGSDVSIFDNVNIPNRIYEYLISGVVPIVPKNHSIAIEELFKLYNVGYVYENLKELKNVSIKEKDVFKPTFEEYLKRIKQEITKN